MSDEIKVGDRFERLQCDGNGYPQGRVCTVVSVDATNVLFDDKGIGGPYSKCHLLKYCDTPEGQSYNFWHRLLPATPTIEQRRAALKPGDLVKDPELLCAGMVVSAAMCPGSQRPVGPHTIVGRSVRYSEWKTTGRWLITDDEFPAGGVTLIAHAPEVKGKVSSVVTVDEAASLGEKLVELAQANLITPSQAEQWYAQNAGQYNQPGAAEQWWNAAYPQYAPQVTYASYGRATPAKPTPSAKALPFRYMPASDDIGNSPYRCPDSAKHDGTQCLTCEGIIAKIMQSGDADMVLMRAEAAKVTRERYEPQCGAFVGRVLTPVGR